MTSPSVQDLFQKGARGAFGKDKPVGYTVQGAIYSVDVNQRTDIDGKPLTWDDGNPQQQLVIGIDTALREDSDDDGKRRVYIPWYGDNRVAIIGAVRAVGKEFPEVGGKLAAKLDHLKPAARKGYDPAKIFAFSYEAPNAAATLFDAGTPSVQTTQQPLLSYPFGTGGVVSSTAQQDPNAAHGQGAYASPPAVPPSQPVDVSGFAGVQQEPVGSTVTGLQLAPPAGQGAQDPRVVAILAMHKNGLTEQQISESFPDFPRAAIAAVLKISA